MKVQHWLCHLELYSLIHNKTHQLLLSDMTPTHFYLCMPDSDQRNVSYIFPSTCICARGLMLIIDACLCAPGHSVLVAAHTSAGKTVVAEYAFAMALR